MKAIDQLFSSCSIILGDLNLSHRNSEEFSKIKKLCASKKISVLNEITRTSSNNQLDYILVKKNMENHCYSTSFFNFISDHKTITVRIAMDGNVLCKEIKEKITFDKELHLRARNKSEFDMHENTVNKRIENTFRPQNQISKIRQFENPDQSTCWLNSCLQLVLVAMDYEKEMVATLFSSELGLELLCLSNSKGSLNPFTVKNILVSTENKRISTELSELGQQIVDKNYLNRRANQINNIRLNLDSGYQCVRDFFICLNENVVAWPDVFSLFSFTLKYTTECSACIGYSEYETTQVFFEIDVPPNGAKLKDYVENHLNEEYNLQSVCEDHCKKVTEKIKRITLSAEDYEAKYVVIVLSRAVQTEIGNEFSKNEVDATEQINLR